MSSHKPRYYNPDCDDESDADHAVEALNMLQADLSAKDEPRQEIDFAIATIRSLSAEIERRKTKPYPLARVVEILNQHEHRKTNNWVPYRLSDQDDYSSLPIGSWVVANDDGDLLEPWEANMIANAYIMKGDA